MSNVYIRNTRELEDDRMGLSDEDYELLVHAEVMRTPVKVLGEACDGYYDVQIGDVVIGALSWYHLTGYTAPCQNSEAS